MDPVEFTMRPPQGGRESSCSRTSTCLFYRHALTRTSGLLRSFKITFWFIHLTLGPGISTTMHDFKIGNLVLDAAPLLSTAASSSAANLRNMAQNFITTPDVVAEIRDKTSRELFSATLQMLGLSSAAPAAAAAAGGAGTSAADSTSTTASPGLQVREATAHAIAKGAF